MKPSNRLLGAAGMFAAPFLTLQMVVDGNAGGHTSLGGLFDLIYMLGWMCSIAGLMRIQAAGPSVASHRIFNVQLAFLFIANIWNVWVILAPQYDNYLFYVLDTFWPLSNLCMLVLGIRIASKGNLRGWRRHMVLMVGLWLPVAMGSMFLFGRTAVSQYIGSAYSIIAWALLGWMIFTSGDAEEKQVRFAV